MAKFPKLKIRSKTGRPEDAYVVLDGKKYRAREIDDSSREQIVIPKLLVIKLESSFASQARLEVEIWKKERKGRFAEYLVPLLSYKLSGNIHYVIQPYVRLIRAKSRISNAKIREITPVIEYLTEKYDMCDLDVDDPGWNWGLRKSDRKPVIFDYGV